MDNETMWAPFDESAEGDVSFCCNGLWWRAGRGCRSFHFVDLFVLLGRPSVFCTNYIGTPLGAGIRGYSLDFFFLLLLFVVLFLWLLLCVCVCVCV